MLSFLILLLVETEGVYHSLSLREHGLIWWNPQASKCEARIFKYTLESTFIKYYTRKTILFSLKASEHGQYLKKNGKCFLNWVLFRKNNFWKEGSFRVEFIEVSMKNRNLLNIGWWGNAFISYLLESSADSVLMSPFAFSASLSFLSLSSFWDLGDFAKEVLRSEPIRFLPRLRRSGPIRRFIPDWKAQWRTRQSNYNLDNKLFKNMS